MRPIVLLLAVLLAGCGINFPPIPIPTPTPIPSPTPVPSPTPDPTPVPTPTPPASQCPTGAPVWGAAVSDAPRMVNTVTVAIAAVKAEHPELFDASQSHLAGWPTNGEAKVAQFYALLKAALERQGVCSVTVTQDPEVKDEIQVLRGDGKSEGYHIINFGGGGVGQPNETFKGTILVTFPAPGPVPTPVPSPSPSPTPVATPTPPAGSCQLEMVAGRLRIPGIAIRQNASRFLDFSAEYFYGTNPDGTPAGPCGRRWCPMGVDGGPTGIACEKAAMGTPVWSVVSGNIEIQPGFLENPFFCKVIGSGVVKVCSETFPTVCQQVTVP